ncbi:MAG TPA: DUF4190 domain-containing protein [Jiangellaceae bacterium]
MSNAGHEFDPYARPANSSGDSSTEPTSGHTPPHWSAGPAGWPSAEPPKGLAVASLVCGISGILLSWFLLGIPSILAVIFGHIALSRAKQGTGSGRELAIAGLITGYVIIGIFALFLFLGFAMFMAVG